MADLRSTAANLAEETPNGSRDTETPAAQTTPAIPADASATTPSIDPGLTQEAATVEPNSTAAAASEAPAADVPVSQRRTNKSALKPNKYGKLRG